MTLVLFSSAYWIVYVVIQFYHFLKPLSYITIPKYKENKCEAKDEIRL